MYGRRRIIKTLLISTVTCMGCILFYVLHNVNDTNVTLRSVFQTSFSAGGEYGRNLAVRDEEGANEEKYKINKTNHEEFGHLKSRWIFYNRMCKSGSRSFVTTFMASAKKHIHGIETFLPNQTNNETSLVEEVCSQDPPFVVIGHHQHINYTQFGHQMPICISLLRDPIERFISEFSYVRYGDDATPPNYKNMDKELLNRSLAQCVNRTYSQFMKSKTPDFNKFCGATLNHEIGRFCGYDKRCRDPDYALQQARIHLQQYLAVGLTEQIEDFVVVLEKLLPDLLSGISRVYITGKAMRKVQKTSSTHLKEVPSGTTMEQLKEMATREYEFYNLVKQRFLNLQAELKLAT